MKYVLDINALIKLYFRKKNNLKIYNKTIISRLVIAEILKIHNWKKDYEERRKQLLFITDNNIAINWTPGDVIITRAFGYNHGFISYENKLFNEKYIRDTYNAILEYDLYENFARKYFGELPFVGKTMNLDDCITYEEPTEEELDETAQFMTNKYNQDFMLYDLLLRVGQDMHGGMKQYQYVKTRKEHYIKIIIDEINKYNGKMSIIKEKQFYREKIKTYDKSLDLYMKSESISIISNDEIERNDGIDLLHLLYVNIKNGDIFVTDDKNLTEIIKAVSSKSVINVNDYLDIDNELVL